MIGHFKVDKFITFIQTQRVDAVVTFRQFHANLL